MFRHGGGECLSLVCILLIFLVLSFVLFEVCLCWWVLLLVTKLWMRIL